MFKASTRTRIGIAAGVVGLIGVGIAAWVIAFSKPKPLKATEACGGFLIDDPQADLLKATPPSASERGKLMKDMECYRRQIRQEPRYADAYANLGEASRRLGDLAQAREFHQKAIGLNPKLQQAKLGLALVEQESGNSKAAVEAIEAVIKIKESAIAYFYQGVTFYKQDNLKDAETAFRKAIELDSNYADARVNLGLVLERNGNFEAAIYEIKAATRIKPNFTEAYFNLGVILQDRGQLEAAIAAYKEAIRTNPNHAEANYNLGIALKNRGRATEAIAAYKEAIRINPNYTIAYVNLGANLVDRGEPEEAIAQLRKAIRLKPDDAEAYNNLGVALFKQKNAAEAISKWQEAIRINPNYAEARHNLGVALASQGKLEEAIANLRQASNLYRTQGYTQKADKITRALQEIGVR